MYRKKHPDYDILRVLLSLVCAHKHVSFSIGYNCYGGSMAHENLIRRISNMDIRHSVAPAQKYFDDFVYDIMRQGINLMNIEEVGATVMLWNCEIPTSFLSIGKLIPLLDKCSSQNDYDTLFRFINTVLMHYCDIGYNTFTVSENTEIYNNVLHAVHATYCSLKKVYAYISNITNIDRKIPEEGARHDELKSNMCDTTAFNMLIDSKYLSDIGPDAARHFPDLLTVNEKQLLRFVIGVDINRYPWIMNFPLFRKIRGMYDVYGLLYHTSEYAENACLRIDRSIPEVAYDMHILDNVSRLSKAYTPITYNNI